MRTNFPSSYLCTCRRLPPSCRRPGRGSAPGSVTEKTRQRPRRTEPHCAARPPPRVSRRRRRSPLELCRCQFTQTLFGTDPTAQETQAGLFVLSTRRNGPMACRSRSESHCDVVSSTSRSYAYELPSTWPEKQGSRRSHKTGGRRSIHVPGNCCRSRRHLPASWDSPETRTSTRTRTSEHMNSNTHTAAATTDQSLRLLLSPARPVAPLPPADSPFLQGPENARGPEGLRKDYLIWMAPIGIPKPLALISSSPVTTRAPHRTCFCSRRRRPKHSLAALHLPRILESRNPAGRARAGLRGMRQTRFRG